MALNDAAVDIEPWRDRVTLGLMALAAVAVLAAITSALPALGATGPAIAARIEAGIGAVFFAVLFVLLGYRPRSYPFLFELVILHRVVLGAFGIVTTIGGAMGALVPALADTAIAILIAAAYVFGRGFDAW